MENGNTSLKAVWLESGFGGEGGSNRSDPSAVKRKRIAVEAKDEELPFRFLPYAFGDYYGNYPGPTIVITDMKDDAVYLTIGGEDVVLTKDSPKKYGRLPGISYDTYAYYEVEALY